MSYVELHCHSAYSFLDGASSPEELAARAAKLGYPALALTDHDGVWGSMEFAQACKAFGVRPIVGAEVTVAEGGAGHRPLGHIAREKRARPSQGLGRATLSVRGAGAGTPDGHHCFHLTLLVESATGWKNLCRLLTEAHRGTRPKPDREPLPPSVTLEEVERYAEGLVCLSGCARDGALAGVFERAGGRPSGGDSRATMTLGRRLRAAFGHERFRVELQRPFWRHDRARNRWLSGLAERLGVPCVATGNVHVHDRSRAQLQDALVSVRLGGTLEETEPWRRGNSSAHLLPAPLAAEHFRDYAEAAAESGRLAERLGFDLTRELGYSYPGAEDPEADRALAEICKARLEHRYGGMPERAEAERRLEEELGVIRSLRLSGFFLLHYDLLELAREVAVEVRGPDTARSLLPPGRGRGSSVSSIVCYLTGLSHVDPVRAGLFLGRFLNEEITEPPDIDLDFPRDIRETLIPRIHERYGPERSALVSAFACYRSRGAVRDLGKALGLPPGEIERVARAVELHGRWERVERDITEALGTHRGDQEKTNPAESLLEAGSCSGLPEADICSRLPGRWRALARLAREAWGLPRHVSQHPGGMVLSTRPLVDLCPVQPAAMEGRQIVQWDKDSCADAGFLKIDLLGLGMLSAVERCVDEIARVRGERVDLSRIPLDDQEVFAAIRRADTTGTFQIESRAQMQMLPRSRPENLEDLTVQVALVRPGPIQGGAVHPYLERRKRLREDPSYEVPYEHPCLEPILRDTLGAIVFQDQVIQVAMALAGFGAGEAEGLRRAMSRKRSEAAINAYRERFIEGASARGVSRALAERVFEQIHGFSGFGFPKSHATAFALLAYQSAWLRVHYGPELLCSLLNEQPMGFYPPDALVHEAQRRGIEVRGPDVNESLTECTVESSLAVRVGLGYINGLAEKDAEAVVRERERGGPYRDLADLASRSGAGRDALQRLAWAGACGSLADGEATSKPTSDSRRRALWRLGVAHGARAVGGGEQLALPLEVPAAPALRELNRWERLVADYGATGVTLAEHPMALMRGELEGDEVTSGELAMVPNGGRLKVAGMVVARQRPATARGVVFMLLEDEEGTVNVIVPPPVYERHRLVVRTAPFVVVGGRVERGEGIVNVVAFRLSALSRPDAPAAEVRQIEPSVAAETGRDAAMPAGREAAGELAAVAPRAHSFGRRGR